MFFQLAYSTKLEHSWLLLDICSGFVVSLFLHEGGFVAHLDLMEGWATHYSCLYFTFAYSKLFGVVLTAKPVSEVVFLQLRMVGTTPVEIQPTLDSL